MGEWDDGMFKITVFEGSKMAGIVLGGGGGSVFFALSAVRCDIYMFPISRTQTQRIIINNAQYLKRINRRMDWVGLLHFRRHDLFRFPLRAVCDWRTRRWRRGFRGFSRRGEEDIHDLAEARECFRGDFCFGGG